MYASASGRRERRQREGAVDFIRFASSYPHVQGANRVEINYTCNHAELDRKQC